jgi:periplasmic protein CpxP/Spy
MSKLKLLTIAVIGLLIMNLGIVAWLFVQKPAASGRRPFDGEGPKQLIIDRLDFDKEQIAAYEILIKAHQSAIRQTEDSIRIAKNQLYATLTTTEPVGKDSLIAKLSDLQKQIEEIHYNHFTDIRKLCKPGQLNDFNRLTEDLAHFFNQGKKRLPPPKD